MLAEIKATILGAWLGLSFLGVTAPTVVDNTTLIPIAAAVSVGAAIALGVWKVGRYCKGIEDSLGLMQKKSDAQEERIVKSERLIEKLINSRNWEMDTLRQDMPKRDNEDEKFHPATVLVVDDESADRFLARRKLTAAGFTVLEADSLREARAVMGRGTAIDCVLLDLKLPDGSGAQTVADFIRDFPTAMCLAFSGSEDPSLKAAAIAAGADAFVSKAATADPRYMAKMVAHAIERSKLKEQK